MKKLLIASFIVSFTLLGCQQSDDLEAKKEKLSKLKEDLTELDVKIATLEKEILEFDSTWVPDEDKGTLVNTINIETTVFDHYIEVQGTAESKETILLSAEIGGVVKSTLVKEGDVINKGQLLLQIDSRILQKNLDDLQTSLGLAQTIYQKQKNLWDQEIGSEIQYLQAKTGKESLEKKVQTLKAQIELTQVSSPIDGTVDEVFIKKGEMAGPGTQLIRVVNLGNIYTEADVSEAYVGKFNKGDTVQVSFPSLKLTQKGIISAVGQYINPMNRTFKVEALLLEKSLTLKPNLMSVIRLKDFTKREAIVVPSKYILHNGEQAYVFLAQTQDGNKVSHKVNIETGQSYKGKTLVISGLKESDQLITEGSMEVADAEEITILN